MFSLSETQKKEIIDFVDLFIKSQFDDTVINNVLEKSYISNQAGIFVSFYIDKELNGCRGTSSLVNLTPDNIQKYAFEAAFKDSRFKKIAKADLNKLDIEISFLYNFETINFGSPKELLSILSQKNLGVTIEAEEKKALYLPSVWQKKDNVPNFLADLCLKAGLDENAWLRGSKICSFDAYSFRKSEVEQISY